MRFCSECNNLLMSKNKTLFCKTCGKRFEIDPKEKTDYMIVRQMKHDETELKTVLLKNN